MKMFLKAFMIVAAGALTLGRVTLQAEAADFTVSRVTVQQRWPWNCKVDIDYLLDSLDGSPADMAIELYNNETKLTVPVCALSGDVAAVAPGFRRITFDPTVSGLEATTYHAFNVRLSAAEVSLYLIIDLTKDANEDGLLTPVTATALKSGAYGTYQENPVSGIESLIWTGVTNDAAYATTKLVLRRVNAGTFKWGGGFQAGNSTQQKRPQNFPATNVVHLTQPYYVGVFEMTQAQWKNIMGSYQLSYYRLNRDRRPCERLLTEDIRGSDYSWPGDGYQVADGTILKALRDKTGMIFDLPTEAQWEYAARAGVETPYADNYSYPNTNIDTSPHHERVELLGRFSTNGGGGTETSNSGGETIDTDHGTAVVGSYLPNARGLYDVHGNVRELILDAWSGSDYETYPGTDPAGASTGSTHPQKGGCHFYDVTNGYFGHRWNAGKGNQVGLRVVAFPQLVTPRIGDLKP